MGGSSAVLVDSFRLTFVEPLHLRLCVGSIDLLSLSLSLFYRYMHLDHGHYTYTYNTAIHIVGR